MAYSFGSSGSTPQSAQLPGLGGGSTPQAKALSSAGGFQQNSVTPASNAAPFSATKPQTNSLGQLTSLSPANPLAQGSLSLNQPNSQSYAGMLQPPTQPVTSHTVNNVDGSSVKQTYAVPETPATQSSANPPAGTANGTVSSSNGVDSSFPGIVNSLTGVSQQGSSQGQQTTADLASKSAAGSAQGQGITTNLANTSAASSPTATQYAAQTAGYGAGNIPIGQRAEGIANNYSGQISDVAKNAAAGGVGMLTSGALNPIALGRASAIEQNSAAEQQALAAAGQLGLQGTSQALTGQNQAAGASNEAAGQANTQQANIQSGLANAGQLANTAQSNVQSGLESAGSLANTAQANKQSGLNAAGTLAYPVNMSPGNYLESPTGQQVGAGQAGGIAAYQNFQNALSNSSIASSNAETASGISQNMQQLSGASGQVIDLMNQVGPNLPTGWDTTPIANSLNSTYLKNQNPAAAASITAGLNDMQGYVSSLLGSLPGQTPTALTNAVQNADFSKLSPSQLQDVMTNIQNYASTRLGPVQSTANSAESANLGGSTPTTPLYTGNAANPSAMTPGTTNSTGTAVAGSAALGVASFYQDILSALGKIAPGGAAGAGAGAAESLLAP